jgi:hypothetical protein
MLDQKRRRGGLGEAFLPHSAAIHSRLTRFAVKIAAPMRFDRFPENRDKRKSAIKR